MRKNRDLMVFIQEIIYLKNKRWGIRKNASIIPSYVKDR